MYNMFSCWCITVRDTDTAPSPLKVCRNTAKKQSRAWLCKGHAEAYARGGGRGRAYLWHADGELLHSLVDLLDQLISHLLHDQNHLDCCTPLPTVAEPSLHARCANSQRRNLESQHKKRHKSAYITVSYHCKHRVTQTCMLPVELVS